MFNVLQHGNSHYKTTCENCCCVFEYDKRDIKDYIENGEKVFKIHCPECGAVIAIEGEKDAGS